MLQPLTPPPYISAAVSSTEPWPIFKPRPSLQYESLSSIEDRRRNGLSEPFSQVLPTSPAEVLTDLELPPNEKAFYQVAVGLLYLAHGFADECHALVTPLSWADETLFGYGTPCPGTAAEAAATYAHCLLHRWEGSNIGEFNMLGYANSNFWGKAALARSASQSLPFDEVRIRIEHLLQLTDNHQSNASPISDLAVKEGRDWFQEWIVMDLEQSHQSWEPRALTELCKSVELRKDEAAPLAQFCAYASKIECDVLLQYCLSKAGFKLLVLTTD